MTRLIVNDILEAKFPVDPVARHREQLAARGIQFHSVIHPRFGEVERMYVPLNETPENLLRWERAAFDDLCKRLGPEFDMPASHANVEPMPMPGEAK